MLTISRCDSESVLIGDAWVELDSTSSRKITTFLGA